MGLIALLAAPPVRRTLRSATVGATVGALRAADGLRLALSRMGGEAREIIDDARERRELWRRKGAVGDGRSWARRAAVRGLAATMDAAEGTASRAVGLWRRVGAQTGAEVGDIGGLEVQREAAEREAAEREAPGFQRDALEREATGFQRNALEREVIEREALEDFAKDAEEVGAKFSPERLPAAGGLEAPGEPGTGDDTHV